MQQGKIYLVSFEFQPFSNGGLARHATEIITRMLKRHNEYSAIIAVPKGQNTDIGGRIFAIPCTYYNNNYLCYLEFATKFALSFYGEFKTSSFVFFSSFSYLYNPLLPKKYSLFVTNTTKRIFLTDYPKENWVMRLFRKTTYFLLAKWEQYLATHAVNVFPISHSTQHDIIDQYDIDRRNITVIPCGVNLRTFAPNRPRKKFPPRLLYVGRIVPRKNVVDLILIVNRLIQKNKKFTLHMVGEGSNTYMRQVKNAVSNFGLQENVIFHGKVSDAQLNRLYIKNGLFVFTSLVEGFGLVLLEAMSKGLPVVAYNVVGVRDIVSHDKNGMLINAGNIKDFVESINFLYNNNKIYQKLSYNACHRIYDFSWDTSINKLHAALKS